MEFLILVWKQQIRVEMSPKEMQSSLSASLDYIQNLKKNDHFVSGRVLGQKRVFECNISARFVIEPCNMHLISFYQIDATDFQSAISIIQNDPMLKLNHILEIRSILPSTAGD